MITKTISLVHYKLALLVWSNSCGFLWKHNKVKNNNNCRSRMYSTLKLDLFYGPGHPRRVKEQITRLTIIVTLNKVKKQTINLSNSVIRSTCCLQSLLSADANSYVCRLDHADVIGTVTNSKGDCSLNVLLHQLDQLGFLERRHSVDEKNYVSQGNKT